MIVTKVALTVHKLFICKHDRGRWMYYELKNILWELKNTKVL